MLMFTKLSHIDFSSNILRHICTYLSLAHTTFAVNILGIIQMLRVDSSKIWILHTVQSEPPQPFHRKWATGEILLYSNYSKRPARNGWYIHIALNSMQPHINRYPLQICTKQRIKIFVCLLVCEDRFKSGK